MEPGTPGAGRGPGGAVAGGLVAGGLGFGGFVAAGAVGAGAAVMGGTVDVVDVVDVVLVVVVLVVDAVVVVGLTRRALTPSSVLPSRQAAVDTMSAISAKPVRSRIPLILRRWVRRRMHRHEPARGLGRTA